MWAHLRAFCWGGPWGSHAFQGFGVVGVSFFVSCKITALKGLGLWGARARGSDVYVLRALGISEFWAFGGVVAISGFGLRALQ